MNILLMLLAALGGYTTIGWLAGTQAWGLKVLEVLFHALIQVPAELMFQLLGAILEGLAGAFDA